MKPREYTCKLLEMVDEGWLDAKDVLQQALQWMSERDVKEMYEEVYGPELEQEEDEETVA